MCSDHEILSRGLLNSPGRDSHRFLAKKCVFCHRAAASVEWPLLLITCRHTGKYTGYRGSW